MRYHIGVRTTGAGSGAPAWELCGTAGPRLKLIELGFSLVAATASIVGLGRAAAIGVTPTTPATPQSYDPYVRRAPSVYSALAWATPPTIPDVFMRRLGFTATIGAGVVWRFDKGIYIPVGTSLILWNLAANSVLDAYADFEDDL